MRVLIADHDTAAAGRHARHLESSGWCTVAAVVHRGCAVLSRLPQEDVDVVLLDLALPDLPGVEVLRRMRSSRGRVGAVAPSVVALTTVRDVDTVRAALSLGVIDYVVAPVAGAELVERADRWRSFRRALDAPILSQELLDRALAALRPPAPAQSTPHRLPKLPKGLSVVTARLVADTLRSATGPLSAGVVATHTGLSRVSARRYLTYFVDHNRVSSTCQYGRAGRPEIQYAWLR